ncbi:unnamed protein product, partial [Linum tenue]
ISQFQTSEETYERTLQEEAKELEQLLSKRNVLLAKQEEYSNKIRELGPLSSDAFDTRKNIKELQRILHRCNEELQKFSHVNKKALDQYVNFWEQREELQKRQAELDAGDEHFREVFSELVQGGHGHLVMMKKKDGDQEDDDDEDDGPRAADLEGRVEKYIGVKVKVCIANLYLLCKYRGQGETQSMKQLSGIDAALDPQYRTAVGNMIRRLADMASTQFITTTFRPELVKVADKIYGVTHKNRVSRVNVVSKDDAIDFVERDQSHNAE